LTQEKYNLFREESEGYSKLITELNKPFDINTAHRIIANIRALIVISAPLTFILSLSLSLSLSLEILMR
jgi:hypothetical protein